LIHRALAGQPPAIAQLVQRLTPVVQRRVAAGLLRCGGYRDLRPEIEDMTQEVLISLFASAGWKLDQWEPERGASLENFVGLIARRHVTSALRTRRANPFTQQPTDPSDFDQQPDSGRSGSAVLSSEARQSLELLAERLQERLSPQGLQMFQLLFVEEREVTEIAQLTGLKAAAIYQWRNRLRKLVAELQQEWEQA
jgi:RNA polymerase sigma-70 factor (ECF subfamily)